MANIKKLLRIIVILWLSGCANPYTKSYTDYTHGKPLTDFSWYDPTLCTPQLISSQNIKSDAHNMLEHSYKLIGESAFYSPAVNKSKAIEQATKVNACIVLLHNNYVISYPPRYLYDAAFFVKQKPLLLGVEVTEIPQEVRQTLQRNLGAYVSVVIDGSPAFNANILEGDLITSFAGIEITSAKQIPQLTLLYAGKVVQITIVRKGDIKTFDIKLSNYAP